MVSSVSAETDETGDAFGTMPRGRVRNWELVRDRGGRGCSATEAALARVGAGTKDRWVGDEDAERVRACARFRACTGSGCSISLLCGGEFRGKRTGPPVAWSPVASTRPLEVVGWVDGPAAAGGG